MESEVVQNIVEMRHGDVAHLLLVIVIESFLELGVDVARQIVSIDLGGVDL